MWSGPSLLLRPMCVAVRCQTRIVSVVLSFFINTNPRLTSAHPSSFHYFALPLWFQQRLPWLLPFCHSRQSNLTTNPGDHQPFLLLLVPAILLAACPRLSTTEPALTYRLTSSFPVAASASHPRPNRSLNLANRPASSSSIFNSF